MLIDKETTDDLLNFITLANTASDLIIRANDEPVSIGVSGGWGVGKSSLVKMIGESLKNKTSEDKKNYILIEFNAWLYQGYEDARMALLQKVADILVEKAKENKTLLGKAKDFMSRINWLRLTKSTVSVASSAFIGASIGGPIGALVGVGSTLASGGALTDSQTEGAITAIGQLSDTYKGVLNEKTDKSIPQEISELRNLFETLLVDLDIRLVVLVDDLDRCLPNTAISTLEAMRLLLFIKRTTFIIAADEQMIRTSVKAHFGIDISDDLVTSYFDKLIQIPLAVPQLGINEVKVYLLSLFTELAFQDGRISKGDKDKAKSNLLKQLKKSWEGVLTHNKITKVYKEISLKMAEEMTEELESLSQLASIMISSPQIAGNPRLIKRFLNNLVIRKSMASQQEMNITFDSLVKMQLFERCASQRAFTFLANEVAKTTDGKLEFLEKIESEINKEEGNALPDEWNEPFMNEWIKLKPTLGTVDLRPLVYLSKNSSISFYESEDLSDEAQELLEILCNNYNLVIATLKTEINKITANEASVILRKIRQRARTENWKLEIILNAIKFSTTRTELSAELVEFLSAIIPQKRDAAIIPLIQETEWAKELLVVWYEDEKTPETTKKAIQKG